LDIGLITEEVTHSWYADDTGGNTPDVAVVTADAKKKGAYSWIKSPRYNGEAMEVGPLARQWVTKNPDIVALGDKAFSVMGRHLARARETSQIAKAMKEWVLQLQPGQPVCTPHELPKKEVVGVGLCEASRGALGHWHRISSGGRTMVYNAVVPTTWNSGPRTGSGAATVRGPMEEAIVGTSVADPQNPVELVRIVRSMDPCYGCAIHVMTPNKKTISQFAIN
jgi:hydrogenase large subunit